MVIVRKAMPDEIKELLDELRLAGIRVEHRTIMEKPVVLLKKGQSTATLWNRDKVWTFISHGGTIKFKNLDQLAEFVHAWSAEESR